MTLILSLYSLKLWTIIVTCCVLGLFFFPLLPTMIEFGSELVFPVGEVNK